MLPTGDEARIQAWLQLDTWVTRATGLLGSLGLGLLLFLTAGLRYLRLADPNYYYLFSPDSYFFHWLAQRVMAGLGPPANAPFPEPNYSLQSGLAYPLAYIAKGVAYVFNISPDQSLTLAAKFLPLALAVITLAALYFAASRMWGRRVALLTALAWTFLFYAVFIGNSGYIDRDGLSVLLLLIGALIFYFFKGYRARIGKIEVGWLLAGLGVLGVEGLLYLEWGITGAVLMIGIILVYFVVKALAEYVQLLRAPSDNTADLWNAVKKLEWRPLALIAAFNLVFVGIYYHDISWYFPWMWHFVSARLSGQINLGGAAEATGLTPWDLIYGFQFFLVLIVAGLYSAWKRKDDASILFLGWFISFFVLSLFAWRFLLYAVPATSIIAGLGLNHIWEWRLRGEYRLTKTVGVIILLVLLILFSSLGVASQNNQSTMTIDENWQNALSYIKDDNNTPPNAVIMSQWSYGYWILDVGQRTPFIDNGYYGYDPSKLYDVGSVYVATDPAQAAQIMAQCGTQYVIFSTADLEVADAITSWAGLKGYDSFPSDSLVVRSLSGDFDSGGGLEVVYHNDEVVILKLAGSSAIGQTMH
jgi:asparagine N-glycosylation enzyme membrane subunit Stt3